MNQTIDTSEKLQCFDEHWKPHAIERLNGQLILLAKVCGSFVWHAHKNEDELFIVLKGKLNIDFRDGRTETISSGQLFVVPKGMEHRPWTEEGHEAHIMLIEPETTKHTGEVVDALTQGAPPWI